MSTRIIFRATIVDQVVAAMNKRGMSIKSAAIEMGMPWQTLRNVVNLDQAAGPKTKAKMEEWLSIGMAMGEES